MNHLTELSVVEPEQHFVIKSIFLLVLLVVAAGVKLSESLLDLLWCQMLAKFGEFLRKSRMKIILECVTVT